MSTVEQPHPNRAKAILKAHPEIRRLFGRNPWTALILCMVAGLQLTIALIMGRAGLEYWWLALIVAYGIGAFANHSLYVIIHEATHNLIFKNRLLNKASILSCDLINAIPGGVGFAIYHIPHHVHLGSFDRDPDIASEWEARLVGNRWYMKALWLLCFPVFQIARLSRITSAALKGPWFAANLVLTLAFDLVVAVTFGWNALLYLVASTIFGLGLHPLGARWIQEHHTVDPNQETASYYGPLNRLALNMGYHNEHHDFPAVPWNRLPAVKAAAPEFYDSLMPCTSWSGLLGRFIFDSRYSLRSRVVRAESVAQRDAGRSPAAELDLMGGVAPAQRS